MKPARFWWSLLGALTGLLVLGGAALAADPKPLGTGPLPPSAGVLHSPKVPPPAGVVNPLQEGFESGTLGDFASAVTTCAPGSCGATPVMTYTHSGAYAAFLPDVGNISDQQLVLTSALALPAGATSAGLSFWQRYSFETSGTSYYDGGVLEVSTNGGSTWTDAGANITSGVYTATIATGTGNPLGGRMGWGGSTGNAFQQVQVNLLPYAGQNLLFRLRLGTDASGADAGWWIDDLHVTYAAVVPCGPAVWSQAAPYPGPIVAAAVVAQGGALYSFGGIISGTITANAYKYDPAAGVWSALAPLPAMRYGAGAVSDGTAIYILNGGPGTPSNTLYRYNPANNTYTSLPAPNIATMFQGAAYLSGKIYRVGGRGTSGNTNTVEVYNLATNIWAAVVNYPQSIRGPQVLAHNGFLYAAGGQDATSGGTVKTYRYDPSLNCWEDGAIADLPGPLYGGSGDFYNGRWLLAGGTPNGNSIFDSVVAWDPAANTWSSLTTMPQGEVIFGAATVGESFYTVGGQFRLGSSYYSANVQQYTEAPCGTTTPTVTATATPGGPTATATATVTPGGPSATPCPINFSDVQPSDYFYTPVQYLYCRGVISGYADNTFRPNNPTTRAQLSKIVALGFALPSQTPAAGAYTFTDVLPGSTFFTVVETAAAHHLVSGYTCGGTNPQTTPPSAEPCDPASRPYFRPSNNVTRGQLSKIVVLAAGWPQVHPATAHFSDVPSSNIFYPFIETAFCRGVISGYNDGTFRPSNPATRGQISKIVYLALNAGLGACPAP